MRDWLKQSLLSSFALYLAAAVYPGLIIPTSALALLWLGLVLTLLNRLAKPIIKLILLPLNLVTLGLLGWLSQVLVLLIADNLLPQLTVAPAAIPAWQGAGFSAPAIYLNPALSYIAAALTLNLAYQLLQRGLCPDC